MRMATLEVYKAKDAQFYWRLIAPNGRIIADGSEGYKRKANAARGAMRHLKYVRQLLFTRGWQLPSTAAEFQRWPT